MNFIFRSKNIPVVSLTLLGAVVIKALIATSMPVFADEAYYYIWSLRPQLSYFDHPPMVSWLIFLGQHLFPGDGDFTQRLALRFPFLFASFLTALIWVFILLRQGFSKNTISLFLVMCLLSPLLGPGSVVATPDVPLVLFWSLSFLAFSQIFLNEEVKDRSKLFYYGLLGVSLGAGFCAKYHIVLFVLSGILYLAISGKYKKIQGKGVLLTLFFGSLFSLPVLIWNYNNDWASFGYQLKHGFGKKNYNWEWTVNFFLGQALLIGPLPVFYLFKSCRKKIDSVFVWVQTGFFTLSSFKAIVEANWPITSHLHATANFLSSGSNSSGNKRKIIGALLYWAVIYLSLAIYFQSASGKKTLRNQYRSSQMSELVALVDKYSPLYGSSYQIASLLSWQSQKFIPKLNGLSRFDFFDTLPESIPTQPKFYTLKHFDSIWPERYAKYIKQKIEVFDDLKVELYELTLATAEPIHE